ncbi:MAG: hypothetical protein JO337_03965 [Acidimicrobiales bacterium]|nr:hypothetical protein [Acidimicrobiales bacterium]
MARDKRRGGRITPKGTRPPHLRPVDGPRSSDSPVDHIIDSGGRELLDEDDPVAAETWASAMMDMFERARWQARLDRMDAPPFEEALFERCNQRRDAPAAVVAAAFAAVATPTHERLATSVVTQLRGATRPPAWVNEVGRAAPTRGWIASDVFGDQDSLIIGFRQPGRPGEHALVVLVDHNLSGQAKDGWIGANLNEVVESWSSAIDPHMRLDEIPVDRVLLRLRDAMAMSDLWNGDTELRTEDFARHRALIWARLRRAGITDDGPADIEVTPSEREALVRDFRDSEEGRRLAGRMPGADIELLAHHLVDLRSDYEGRPLRWSPTVVSLLLGDLAPRKLLLDSGQAAALPDVVRAFVRFSAKRSGLEPTLVDETVAAVDEMEPAYLESMGDPSAAGPAKAVLTALRARGVDLTDIDAINEALEQGDPIRLPSPAPEKRRRAATAPAEVIASAEAAPVLARFDVLTSFYDDGRKLTQTGQPTLADARQLVSRLGTEDRLDETIGDRTFKTRSAADLPELGFTIRWALSAGALRKEHGKLRATTAWAKLEGKPLQRWLKATEVLPKLGPLAGFFANHRYRHGEEILDELAPEILRMLERRPMDYDEVLDWVCNRADAQYEWLAPYMQDPDHRRMSFGWDLDLLTRILEWAGMANRVDAKLEPDRSRGERLVGGTLQLTRAGQWWLDEPGTSW